MNHSIRNRRRLLFAVLIIMLIGISYAIWSHFQHRHGHKHLDSHQSTALVLNDGKRWETDEPLRLGMQRIRDAVAREMEVRNQQGLDHLQAKTLAEAVQTNVTYLMKNCVLVPKADAALHVLLNDFMTGAAMITTPSQSEEGFTRIVHALRDYPEYFDHPDWKALPQSLP